MLFSQFFTCSNPRVDRCSNPLPWDPLISSPQKDEAVRQAASRAAKIGRNSRGRPEKRQHTLAVMRASTTRVADESKVQCGAFALRPAAFSPVVSALFSPAEQSSEWLGVVLLARLVSRLARSLLDPNKPTNFTPMRCEHRCRKVPDAAMFGKAQMGSALMGSLQMSCF